ncbi:uncharacterized protein [Ptychodera flava]|uniref:uncharacterized protein n=1 Tax=Ptychodera flava TaxID=63121 RepID=UPI00396A7E2F
MANLVYVVLLSAAVSFAIEVDFRNVDATNIRSYSRHRRSVDFEGEILIERFTELVDKYDALESSFQKVLKSNEDLQATVVYQASRITQMQQIVNKIPSALSQATHLAALTKELQDSVHELTIDKLFTTPCQCLDNTFSTKNRMDHSWLNDIEPYMIAELRKTFRPDKVLFSRKSMDIFDDENEGDILDENTIENLSKVLAQLVTTTESNHPSHEIAPSGDSIVKPEDQSGKIQAAGHDQKVIDDSSDSKQMSTKSTDFTRSSNVRKIRNQGKNTSQNNVVEQMEQTLRSVSKSKKKMAFSVTMTTPLFGTDKPQVVIFNEVKERIGKGYDAKKGVFRCIVPGIYYFSYTICSYYNRSIAVTLVHNDMPVVATSMDASTIKVMQSQSVVLSLLKGDEVWIMMGASENYAIYGRNDHIHYNIFNGVLLYPK